MSESSMGGFRNEPPQLPYDRGHIVESLNNPLDRLSDGHKSRGGGLTKGFLRAIPKAERIHYEGIQENEARIARVAPMEKTGPTVNDAGTQIEAEHDLITKWINANRAKIEDFKSTRMWRNYDINTQEFGQLFDKRNQWTMKDCERMEVLMQTKVEVATSWCFLIAVIVAAYHFWCTLNWGMLGFHYVVAVIILYATRSIRQLCTTQDAPLTSRVFHLFDSVAVFYFTIETAIMRPIARVLLIRASEALESFQDDGFGSSFLLRLKDKVRGQLLKVGTPDFWISYAGNIITKEKSVAGGLMATVSEFGDVCINGSRFVFSGLRTSQLSVAEKSTYNLLLTGETKMIGQSQMFDKLVRKFYDIPISELIKGRIKEKELTNDEKQAWCRSKCHQLGIDRVRVTPLINEKTIRGDVRTSLLVTNSGDILINVTKSENFITTIGLTVGWCILATLLGKKRRPMTLNEIEQQALVYNSPKNKD